MKKYTREGLISFYMGMDPDSRPCQDGRDPIAFYMNWKTIQPRGFSVPLHPNDIAYSHDRELAKAFDAKPYSEWTAKEIASLASTTKDPQ